MRSASSSVACPAPGERIRLIANTPEARRCSRLCDARSSFFARMSCSSTTVWASSVIRTSPSEQPQVSHMSDLHRSDAQFAPGQHLGVGAAAGTEQDEVVEGELVAAVAAARPPGRFGVVLSGAFVGRNQGVDDEAVLVVVLVV